MSDGPTPAAAAEATPRGTLARVLTLLRDKDLDALADLYVEDGVHELPFAPPTAPRRLEGREPIRAYFTETLAEVTLEFSAFEEVAVHDTADPEVIVAEYDAHGIVPTTGEGFTTRNIWVLRITGGQIKLWRDYWNPLEILDLQGHLPDLVASMVDESTS